MSDISFNVACKELKIAEIGQLNHAGLSTFAFSLYTVYGHGFHELSRMLMEKNVNNDVSKDSPIKCFVLTS